MKKVSIGVLILVAISFFGCGSTSKITADAKPNIKSVRISAHRGGPVAGFPENALETLINTSKNVKGIMMEIDVAPTFDGVLVLMHDKKLDRTTNLTGFLKDYSLEAIKDGFLLNEDNELTNFKVPTLKEIFNWIQNENVYLSLDMKDKTIFHQVVDLINQFEVREKTEVITYSLSDAEYVHDYDPEINLSVSAGSEEVLNKLLNAKINTSKVSVFTGLTLKKKEFYQSVRNHGMTVTLGTIGNLDNKAKARGFQVFNNWNKLGINRYATDYYVEVNNAISKK
ncbi:MAG: glycerophosphodiester phosphodiesterase family protein [Croceivirga sp.]